MNYQGGVKNRRKRALQRNEAQLGGINKELVDTTKQLDLMEKSPKDYHVDKYKQLLSRGDVLNNSKNRLEKEIEVLKTRI